MSHRIVCPLNYALITAARNESAFIELTLRSMMAQTVRPLRWIIVNDGSTDETEQIVRKHAAHCQWIELLQMPHRPSRSFAGKAEAVNSGYAAVRHLDFDLIGNLDADVSFKPGFFAFLLEKFVNERKLGVAGTAFTENGRKAYDYRLTSADHVSGQVQLFRRECFDEIGGYTPVQLGGIDVIAVTAARIRGWRTRTFTDETFEHHRPMGAATYNAIARNWMLGRKDYALGAHPLWQYLRCAYQLTKSPFLIRGSMLLVGYIWSAFRSQPRPVSPEFIRFRRAEQMTRLRTKISSFVGTAHSKLKAIFYRRGMREQNITQEQVGHIVHSHERRSAAR